MIEPDKAPEVEVDSSSRTVAVSTVAPGGEPRPLSVEQAQQLIATLEREAKALGNDPAAARLHYEMGLLCDEQLKNAPKAAVCFQSAHRLAPKHLANLRAARRLFTAVGNWQMVAQLLEAEAAAVDGEPHKRVLELQRAHVLEQRLGRSDEALALLEQCRQAAPRDPNVLIPLEATYRASGDSPKLREVLVALADAVEDPALKAYYLGSAARLDEGPLGTPSEAAPLIRRAFELERGDPELIAAAKRVAEREGDVEALLKALSAEAQAASGAAAAPIHHRRSRILERQGRRDEALLALLEGRRAAPRDLLILDELARAFESSGRHEDLADVLKARAAGLEDPAELIAVQLQLGAVYEEKLAREDEAIACYRAVLATAPAHPTAIVALGKLYSRRQDWEGLLQTYELEIAGSQDVRLKSSRLYRAAELLENRLGRGDEAIARYNQTLALQPGYLPAQKALIRLYERLERWGELVALYEEDLGQTRDRDQMLSLLSRIASVQEERQKDLPRAVSTLKRILELAPDHLPTVRALARLCERAGLWEELIQANELEAALAGDSKQVISLLHSNAEICEEQLKQRDRAIDAYRKVLNLSASYLPALQALGRLYAQSGRWAELVEMYRREAEVAPSPEQAASLLYKAGELEEEKLSQPDEAIAAYQEVLTLSPSHFPALRALARIYRAQGAFESLVEVLRADAAARADRSRRASILFQVGALWEDELGRPELALDTYLDALANVPDHAPSFRALERLYAHQGAFAELAALLEREVAAAATDDEKVCALQKAAHLYGERLREPAKADRAWTLVLALRPGHLGALKALEALRTADPAGRADVRARIAAALKDPPTAAAHLWAASLDRERVGDAAPALDELRRAVELAPDDPRAAEAYEAALRRAGDFAALATLLEKRLSRAEGGEPWLAQQMRLGEVYEWRLGRAERALDAYRAVLDVDPRHLAALRAARRVTDPARAPVEAHRLLVAEAEATRDVPAAVDLFLDASALAEGALGDPAAARADYQAALARDGLEPRATARLEDLLAREGGSEELAALHLKRSETRAQANDPSGAATEALRSARVLADGHFDPSRALAAVEQALALVSDHPEALELKGELCLRAADYTGAAQAFARRVEEGGEPAQLATLHHKLGVLYQDRLGDPARASAHLQTALASDPANFDALERVGAIHVAARNWTGAADAFKRLVESEPEPTRLARYLCTCARIAEEGFGEIETAVGYSERALELMPGDPALLERLTRLYERLKNLPRLTMLVELQASAATASGDKAKAALLHTRSAELYLSQGEAAKALQAYRLAVDLAPDDGATRAAFADLLTREGPSPAAAIDEHRALLRIEPYRLESYHALYQLYLNSRQMDRAVCAGDVLAFFRSLTGAEDSTFLEAKGRVPVESSETLGAEELDGLLQHPLARGPLSALMRVVGDQLHKIYEPAAEVKSLGRGNRLKPDHPLHKLVRAHCAALGVEKFEIYQGKAGASVQVENTDPLSLVLGPDLVRRNNAREQSFLIGRACWFLRNKMPLALRLEAPQLADLLGGAVRIVSPLFERLGRPDAELSRRLRKAMSGKALRLLAEVAPEVVQAKALDLAVWHQAATDSGNRAGMLLCGEVGVALPVLFREEPGAVGIKSESTDALLEAARRRRDFTELLGFALSDDHFRLRAKLRLTMS